ncbi:hypothetical protein [Acinetobacter indicus]|uniref:hypothetical protein n=1 Tax=Acinetobacter indicus TaxID=756892 RepID=UPI0014446F5D|nr:hypothetical protein [Acinetobacter indicus]
MDKEILNLLGTFVSFESKDLENQGGEKRITKGLVTFVCFSLDGDHEICIKEFDDTEDFHKVSEISSLKIAQLDPYAFFENIKSGVITVDV